MIIYNRVMHTQCLLHIKPNKHKDLHLLIFRQTLFASLFSESQCFLEKVEI